MIPKTKEQKRVASLINKSKPLGKRAINRIMTGAIAKDNVKRCYFCQWEKVEEYQVFRYFDVKRNLHTKKITMIKEVIRNYYNCTNKEQTTVAKRFTGLYSYKTMMPIFSNYSNLEVRGKCNSIRYTSGYEDTECYDTYVKSVNPLFKSTRVTPQMTELLGSSYFLHELNNSKHRTKIETAIEMGDINLTGHIIYGDFYHIDIETFWRCVLIARRHGFDFSKTLYKDYKDYLYQLKELGKDIHSPKYLCPENFEEEHRRTGQLLDRKREKERRIRDIEYRKRRAEEDKKAIKEFEERIQKYEGLAIMINKNITAIPLKNIKEFKEEGDAMHHCVYTNRYYALKDSLILSARNEKGERVETIEYSLKTNKVEQSRGICNQSTPYHEDIIRVIEKKMPQLLKRKKTAAA